MPNERKVVTKSRRYRQGSLFSRAEIKPFVKRRWTLIMQRLREESRQMHQEGGQNDRTARLGPDGSTEPSEPKRL